MCDWIKMCTTRRSTVHSRCASEFGARKCAPVEEIIMLFRPSLPSVPIYYYLSEAIGWKIIVSSCLHLPIIICHCLLRFVCCDKKWERRRLQRPSGSWWSRPKFVNGKIQLLPLASMIHPCVGLCNHHTIVGRILRACVDNFKRKNRILKLITMRV